MGIVFYRLQFGEELVTGSLHSSGELIDWLRRSGRGAPDIERSTSKSWNVARRKAGAPSRRRIINVEVDFLFGWKRAVAMLTG